MITKLILLLAGTFIVMFIQIKRLAQQQLKREIWGCSFFYLLAVGLAASILIGLSIPTPLKLLEWIYEPLVTPLL